MGRKATSRKSQDYVEGPDPHWLGGRRTITLQEGRSARPNLRYPPSLLLLLSLWRPRSPCIYAIHSVLTRKHFILHHPFDASNLTSHLCTHYIHPRCTLYGTQYIHLPLLPYPISSLSWLGCPLVSISGDALIHICVMAVNELT